MTTQFLDQTENTQTVGQRRIFGVPLTRLLGVILTPLLIAGVFIAGLWDPTARLNTVTAAVVNLDEPVEVDGQITPLGRVLAGELIGTDTPENFAWELTSAEEAAKGLENGKYVTVVTIPENFSAAATSLSDGPKTAEQANIDIQTSERGKLLDPALSAAVTSTALKVINNMLGKAFIENIFVGMNQLGDGLDQVADGAGELADGAGQLASGMDEFALGTGDYEAGISQYASGSAEFARGIGTYAEGARQFASGINELANGIETLSAESGRLVAGHQEITGGAAELSAGLNEYVTGINSIIVPIKLYLKDIIPTLEDVIDSINKAVAEGALTQEEADELIYWMENYESEIGKSLANIDEMTDQLIYGGEQLAEGSQDLAYGLQQFDDGLQQYTGGVDQIAAETGALKGGAQQLAQGAEDLAGGANELSSGAYGLAAGAGEIREGAYGLAGGTSDLADGSTELAGGLDTIAGEIPRYTDAETSKFAEIAIEPVIDADQKQQLFQGTGAPLFVSLALWAGSLAIFLVFSPLWSRTRDAARSEAAITLRNVIPGALVGATQGALVGVGVGAVLSLSAVRLLLFIMLSVVIGVVFVLLNQALIALLGGYGKFVSIIVLAVGFVAGIISTVPGIIASMSRFTPFGVSESSINLLLDPTSSATVSIIWLLVWGGLGFFLTGWAVHRKRAAAF